MQLPFKKSAAVLLGKKKLPPKLHRGRTRKDNPSEPLPGITSPKWRSPGLLNGHLDVVVSNTWP